MTSRDHARLMARLADALDIRESLTEGIPQVTFDSCERHLQGALDRCYDAGVPGHMIDLLVNNEPVEPASAA